MIPAVTGLYLGYGHRKLPGEKFFRGYKMSEREADALLRKDLRKFCALYRDMGKDSILLGALAYNIGPRVPSTNPAYIKCSNPVIATSSKPTPPIATTKANGTKDYWNVVIQNWSPYSFHKTKSMQIWQSDLH